MIFILTVTIEGVTSCAPAILGLGAVFSAFFSLAGAGIAGARLLHFLCRLGLSIYNLFCLSSILPSILFVLNSTLWWHFLGKWWLYDYINSLITILFIYNMN